MLKEIWRNWAGNLQADANCAAPRSLEELQKLVREAAAAGKRIRPTGGSFSWAPLVPTEGVIVRMHNLDQEIKLHLSDDPENGPDTIEVQGGMTIKQLNEIVTRHGRTLVSPTLFPLPTVGGAVAAGCHGTNRDIGNFSDMVEEITFVKADGDVRKIHCSDEEFPAAQVSLGTFGIIYSVRLRLVEQYNVRLEKRYLPIDEVIDGFEDLQASAQHLELFWFPFQPKMWVYIMNETTDLPDPVTLRSRLSTAFVTFFENNVGGKMLPWIAKHMPQLTPLVSYVAGHVANREGVKVQTASRMFHFQKSYPKCWDLSYSFPHDDADVAWREGISLINQYREAGLFPVNLPLHGRFTGSSSALIAPDYGRKTGYIEVVTICGTPDWHEFFEEMEERWLAMPRSRPHWCKLYDRTDAIKGRYTQMDRFLEIRESWDPDRVFLNSFLEHEVFQLPALSERASLAPPSQGDAAKRNDDSQPHAPLPPTPIRSA